MLLYVLALTACAHMVSAMPARMVERDIPVQYKGLAVTAWCTDKVFTKSCQARLYFPEGNSLMEYSSAEDDPRTASTGLENKWFKLATITQVKPDGAIAVAHSILPTEPTGPNAVPWTRVFSFSDAGVLQESMISYTEGMLSGKWTTSAVAPSKTGYDYQRIATMAWVKGGVVRCSLFYIKEGILYEQTVEGNGSMSTSEPVRVDSNLPGGLTGLSVSSAPNGDERRLFAELDGGVVREYHHDSTRNIWLPSQSVVQHTKDTFAGTFAALYVPGHVLNRMYTLSSPYKDTSNIEEWWPNKHLTGWEKNGITVGPSSAASSRMPLTAAFQPLSGRVFVLSRRRDVITQVTYIRMRTDEKRFEWVHNTAILCGPGFDACV